jgi:hypothetical protein
MEPIVIARSAGKIAIVLEFIRFLEDARLSRIEVDFLVMDVAERPE